VVFALAYGTMFVVRPAAMIARDEYYFLFAPYLDIRTTFNEMLLLALLGAVAFQVGYFVPLGRRIAARAPSPRRDLIPRRLVAVSLFAASVGLLLFALFVDRAGGLPALSIVLGGRSDELQDLIVEAPKYLYYGPVLLAGPAILLSALAFERKSTAVAVMALVLVTLNVVIRGSYGSRLVLLPVFGAIVIYWYLHRYRRPGWTALAVLGVASVLVSAAIANGRLSPETEGGAVASYASALQDAVTSPLTALEPILEGADASMAPGLAAAMVVVPEHLPHEYGLALATDLVSRGIPRQLWPAKPRAAHSRVTDVIAPRGATRSYNLAYSVLLHAYIDWGLLGAVWLAGYGIIARVGFEWFKLHQESMFARLVFALGLLLLVPALRDGPVDTLFRVATILVPIWLAFRVATRPGVDRRRVPTWAPGRSAPA
jgi:hypothetical protein